jgi:hypothetical protein
MDRMLPATMTVLFELKSVGIVAAIFLGSIVSLFAITAL